MRNKTITIGQLDVKKMTARIQVVPPHNHLWPAAAPSTNS